MNPALPKMDYILRYGATISGSFQEQHKCHYFPHADTCFHGRIRVSGFLLQNVIQLQLSPGSTQRGSAEEYASPKQYEIDRKIVQPDAANKLKTSELTISISNLNIFSPPFSAEAFLRLCARPLTATITYKLGGRYGNAIFQSLRSPQLSVNYWFKTSQRCRAMMGRGG